MYEIIDSHAHINEIENIDSIVAGARQRNISAIVAVGTSFLSNQKILKLAKDFNNYIYPALGLFPWNIADDDFIMNMAFIRDNVKNAVGLGKSDWITAKASRKEPRKKPRKMF